MSHPLFKLLCDLDEASIQYTVARDRPDTVRVNLTFIGERVEVDVFEDGHKEVSRSSASEDIVGDEALVEELVKQNEG